MADSNPYLPAGGFAPLVPELEVTDLAASLAFWCGPCGFTVAYDRPEKKFAYLERTEERIQVMLCTSSGTWNTGTLDKPLGRGINFQFMVTNINPILSALKALNWPLFQDVEEAWYRVGDQEYGNREFLVQDPDGYLLRFAQDLGARESN